MSKSTGNFLTLTEAVERFSADGQLCKCVYIYIRIYHTYYYNIQIIIYTYITVQKEKKAMAAYRIVGKFGEGFDLVNLWGNRQIKTSPIS